MEKIKQLAAMVLAWALARNLVDGSDAKTQTLKTVSEFGEFAVGATTHNQSEVKDGIGDILVTLIIVSAQLRLNFETILLKAASVGSHPGHHGILSSIGFATGQLGKIADNAIKGQTAEYEDNAAKLIAILIDIGRFFGVSLEEGLEHAYNEIKDRRGVMYHGAFIKSTDERYASACAELGIPAE